MRTVAIIDYGGSNLRSVAKALEHLAGRDHRVIITSRTADVSAATRVVFPGQGAIRDCMGRLRATGLEDAIREAILGKPYLGICLGLQTLLARSDEDGGTSGLGVYDGAVKRFRAGQIDPATGARLKIPHMGWNTVSPLKAHPLWAGIVPETRFYFVHSYYVQPHEAPLVAAHTDYGAVFASAMADGYVFATQFHPEKSQRAGLQLLKNFLDWDGGS